jgi:superfamily II DNA or RNA helicase
MHRHRYDKTYLPYVENLQCIIVDELHLALNRSNFETIEAIKPPVVFGLTATLELRKKHVFMKAYDMCGPVVFEYNLTKGVAEGHLSKGVAISVEVAQDITLPPIKGNPAWRHIQLKRILQYQELYNKVIVDGKVRNRFIKEFVTEAIKRGKYVIVLLERIRHLKETSRRLDGIPHDLVYGDKHVSQRIASKAEFEKGRIRLILANKVFKKGVDIKRVDIIIDGAGMKSRNDCIQKYGRGVRMCDEKEGLIYIDICDRFNKFEKAGKARRHALKSIGVPVYKIASTKGPAMILDLAEAKLKNYNVQGHLFKKVAGFGD